MERELPVAGRPPRERRDAARNRAAILAAAQRLFEREGPGAVSMERVAEEAGVGKGTIYRRFGDRASLATALLDASERQLQEALIRGPAPVGPGAPPTERLVAFGHAWLDVLARHGDIVLASEHGPVGTRFRSAVYASHRTHVILLLREARPDADAEYLADVLLSALGSGLVLFLRTDRGMDLDRIKAGWTDLVRSVAMIDPPSIEGAERRFVEIEASDGGRLRVHYADAGHGPPLLLLPGWPQHFWCWRRVVPLLADDFRLICPDLRGFGWTDAPGRGYDPDTFAADAVALLDALRLERAGVIGHDWGGFAGFLMALRHPHRVERLLALSTPIPWLRPSPRVLAAAWRSWYAWALAAFGREALVRRPGVVRLMLPRAAPDHAIDEDAAEVYAAPLREPARAEASQLLYRSYVRSAFSMSTRRPYEGLRLTVPTRLVLGRDDQAVPEILAQGYEPHADELAVELLDGAGHFLPEECPDLVAARARELF